jgi:hypothetical protein
MVVMLSALVLVHFLFFGTSTINVSAVLTGQDMGVYWDQDCTNKAEAVDWGTLSPGQAKDVAVYVRNEGNKSFLVLLSTVSWNPQNASLYLTFSRNVKSLPIKVGEVTKAILSLSVSPYVKGITKFAFSIVFMVSYYFLGDLDKNGVVDIRDVAIVSLAFGSLPKSPKWNPDADVDKNGVVDIRDVAVVGKDFGKIWNS